MPARINDPQHWRRRAEEMRALARLADDLDARSSMLGIADEYERLAQRAERRTNENQNAG